MPVCHKRAYCNNPDRIIHRRLLTQDTQGVGCSSIPNQEKGYMNSAQRHSLSDMLCQFDRVSPHVQLNVRSRDQPARRQSIIEMLFFPRLCYSSKANHSMRLSINYRKPFTRPLPRDRGPDSSVRVPIPKHMKTSPRIPGYSASSSMAR
jgi:hypothetical protein